MYTDVDELGSEVWFGEVPAGPDGEPMPRSRHGLADATLRGMRAASVCESIGRSERVVEFDEETQKKVEGGRRGAKGRGEVIICVDREDELETDGARRTRNGTLFARGSPAAF